MKITSTNVLDNLYDFITEIEKHGYKKSEIINFSIYQLCRRFNQITYEYSNIAFWHELDTFCEYFKSQKKSSLAYKLKEVIHEKKEKTF